MSGMKRWLVIGGLALAQAAIVFCYLELQAAAPARATAEQPTPDADKALPVTEALLARPQDQETAPACPAGPPAAPVAQGNDALPALPPGPVSAVVQDAPPSPAPANAAAAKPAPLPAPAPAASPPVKANDEPPAPMPEPLPGPKHDVAPPTPAETVPSPSPTVPPPAGPAPSPTVNPSPALAPVPATTAGGAPIDPNSPPSGVVPKGSSSAHPAAPVVCPWTFTLVIVEGRTVLTAKTGEEVQFKVSCDRLDLQAPNGAIQASGSIKLSSAGLEGSAERLSINLNEDRVVLDGVARLKARRDGQELELQSDRLSLRIIDGRLSDRAEPAEHRRPDL